MFMVIKTSIIDFDTVFLFTHKWTKIIIPSCEVGRSSYFGIISRINSLINYSIIPKQLPPKWLEAIILYAEYLFKEIKIETNTE